MKIFTRSLTLMISFFGFYIPASIAQTFLEEDGLVVIEIESAENAPSNWAEETAFAGFTGEGYFRYDGNNHSNDPGIDVIEYGIFIQNPGLYRFRWRSLIAEGSSTTDSNDSWLKIFGDAFYGLQGTNSIVCPKGYDPSSNDCPVELDDDMNVMPAGSGSDGWFKVYRSGPGDWVWSTQTSDNDAHQIYARFDQSTLYRLQISGRSKNHAIDRLVMYHEDYTGEPLDVNLPESVAIEEQLIFANGFEAIIN